MHRPFSGDSPPPNCLHGCFSSSSSFPGEVTSSDPPQGPTPTVTSATLRRNFAQTTASTIFPETHFTDPNSLPSLQESFSHFIQAYPNYTDTYRIDRIRSDHYFHLGLTHYTCLDYIGIGLYSYSQLLNYDPSTYQISSSLSESPFFSVSPKIGNLKEKLLHDGGQETEFEYSMKRRIMRFLKISEEDYSMVFTANRTSAFRLVAESYPFSKRKLLTVYDYESEAVDEINRVSERRGAKVAAAEFSWPGLRICSSKLRKMVTAGKSGSSEKKKKGVFVFPLHSRVTGSRYPYLWMSVAQENGWHVMIDACGLGPKDMDSFGLSIYNPDFMVCSFYKVFGENPSGFGCLFVKKSTIQILESSTGSGMVNLVPTDDPISLHALEISRTRTESEEVDNSFTSGIEYRGLDHVDSLGLVGTGNRSRCLINWLVSALYKLKHSTTSRLVKIYGPKVNFNRGPAIAFNLFDQKGERIEPFVVQKLADCSNISLGQGFVKKILFEDEYEGVKDRVLEKKKNEQGISVLTAALGFLANFEDVYKLWVFVARFLESGFVETESVRCGVHVFEHRSREVV